MQFCAGEIDDDLWDIEREEEEDPPWVAEAEGGARGELDNGPEGLTLVDARNGFNELSCYAMLWTARHRWPRTVPLQLLQAIREVLSSQPWE